MHVIINLLFLIFFIFFEGIRNAHQYHTTMLFISLVNLFYLILCHDHLMWSYVVEHKQYDFLIEMLYTFVAMPITVYLFLYFCPSTKNKRKFILYFPKWIFCFLLAEYLLVTFDYMEYYNGWNIGWSFIFLNFEFPIIYLHHKKTKIAYAISIGFVAFLIWYFKVPILTYRERG